MACVAAALIGLAILPPPETEAPKQASGGVVHYQPLPPARPAPPVPLPIARDPWRDLR